MQLKLFYILHCYWILMSIGHGAISTIANYGHHRWNGPTGYNQHAYRMVNTPIRYNLNNPFGSTISGHSILQMAPGGFSYQTLHPSPAFNPAPRTTNAFHVSRAASAPAAAVSVMQQSSPGQHVGPLPQPSPDFNPTKRTTNAFHVSRAASAPAAAVSVMRQSSQGQHVGPLPLLLPLSNRETLQNNRKRNIPSVVAPSSENPNGTYHSYVESRTTKLLPKSGRQSSIIPLRQAGLVSPFVEPIQGSQSTFEDTEYDDDELPWTAEYDGTYWDSAGNINAPLHTTKIIIFIIMTLMAYHYIF